MSFIKKRGRVWWYYWRPFKGSPQKAKSLGTPDGVVAEVRKGEEDKKRFLGDAGLPDLKATWDTAKAGFLAGYKAGSMIRDMHSRSLKLFESYYYPPGPSSVSYNKAKEWRDWLQSAISSRGKPFSPTTININLRNLHTFFSEAKRSRLVVENPFKEVKAVPVVKRVAHYLTKEEVRRLIGQARKDWEKKDVLMLLFFLYTGVRRSELVNLRWPSIDLERKLFYIREGEGWTPKDMEEHAIGLHPLLLEGLRRHPRTSAYVFPALGKGPRCKYSIIRLFNRLYKRAGISKTGLHILRHTFATHSGLPVPTLQRVFGHSSISTTQGYVHVTPEDLDAVSRISY